MKINRNFFSTIGIHASLWMIFTVLPFMAIAPLILSLNVDKSQQFYSIFAISSIVLISVFYLNYFLLFPKFYLQKNRTIYLLLTVLIILLTMIVTRSTMQHFYTSTNDFQIEQPIFIFYALLRIILALFLSSSLVIYERWRKLEKERLIAEISFLKAQINPHFLFNTLNGIYTLVLKKSDIAAESISKLSSIMRYVITDAQHEKVLLENELNYISDYIELQKLRLTDTTIVNFEIIGNPSRLKIEPLLLISFIENAFKYGVSTEHAGMIDIRINITPFELQLIVKNNKVRLSRSNNTNDGIGLENTKKRLNRSYNHKHSLLIEESDQEYTVNLILQLK